MDARPAARPPRRRWRPDADPDRLQVAAVTLVALGALVAMAMQPREYRAVLADAFLEFLDPITKRVAARVVAADNQAAFVFTAGDSADREHRARELMVRCLIVRRRCKSVRTVVGIATDRPQVGKQGHSSDIVYLHMPEWDPAENMRIDQIQADLGYFKDIRCPA